MRSLINAGLSTLLLALSTHLAVAQPDELRIGSRIRLTAPGVVAGRLTATIVRRTDDSLTIASESILPLTIAMGRITALEVSRGNSRTDGAMRGIRWSLPFGAALGVAAVAAERGCSRCTRHEGDLSPFVGMVVGSAFWGAGIGAIVGRERWERFELEHHVTLSPRDGRPAFALRSMF